MWSLDGYHDIYISMHNSWVGKLYRFILGENYRNIIAYAILVETYMLKHIDVRKHFHMLLKLNAIAIYSISAFINCMIV